MTPIRPIILLAFTLGCTSKPGVAVFEGVEPQGATYTPPRPDTAAPDDPTDDTATGEDDTGTTDPCVPEIEVCDEIDNDCDGYVDEGLVDTWYQDLDVDGYGDPATTVDACSPPDGFVDNAEDCNDESDHVGPHAEETCNGIDDDCDGRIDEGVGAVYYEDTDGDGFGDPDTEMIDCSPPIGHTTHPGDCDDDDADIHPGADEVCDGIDQDCDGVVDDNPTAGTTLYFVDADGDGFGDADRPLVSCTLPEGYSESATDCDDAAETVFPDATETCNDVDDDCDGSVDEGVLLTWYPDADGDGDGDASGTPVLACTAPVGHSATSGDCDDSRSDIYEGATEVCDEADNDCDGTIDDGVLLTFFLDTDGDGWGTTPAEACTAPADHVSIDGDCDDSTAAIHPGAEELCDDLDNDCDDEVDEDLASWFFADEDGDGWGDPATATETCDPSLDWVTVGSDCDDTRALVYPDAEELCDDLDNDCDDEVDEDLASWFFADEDGDGWGDPATATETCDPSLEWVTIGSDCDDTTALAAPDVVEVCDGIDNDCDGDIDESVTSILHRDRDGDGYGDSEETFETCGESEDWVFDDTDCDDDNPTTHPDADELCDAIDNDCDGFVDEDAVDMSAFYFDGDGDGHGRTGEPVYACTAPDDYVVGPDDEWSFDCDDLDDTIHPGAPETWYDGTDSDCDGWSDYDADGDGDDSDAWGGDDCDDGDDEIHPGAIDECDAVDSNCNGVIDDDGGCPCSMRYRDDGHAYQFCMTGKDWPSSRDECRDEDYELVTINNASEQSWIFTTARTFTSWHWWWIGYSDATVEGTWLWADGSSSTYTFWDPWYFDDWGSWLWPYTGEDCAHLYDDDGRWNDLPCTSSYYGSRYLFYICEASLD